MPCPVSVLTNKLIYSSGGHFANHMIKINGANRGCQLGSMNLLLPLPTTHLLGLILWARSRPTMNA